MTLEVIMFIITAAIYPAPRYNIVVSIEFSPLSSVELTNSWYQLHNGDYKGILNHTDLIAIYLSKVSKLFGKLILVAQNRS